MADNIPLPATSGNVATDDCGAGGHAQIMKLAVSADGTITLIPADATNGLDVDVTRVPTDPFGANADASSPTGSYAAKLRAIAEALQLIDDIVKADDAGFTAGTDKVSMIGALAVAIGSDPDAADANDAAAPLLNRHRVQFTIGGHPNILTLKHTTITTAVTDAAIITVGSGNKICVTRLTATLDNASTVFPTVLIGFGATTTPTTTGVIAAHGGVPAGGGFNIGDGSGVIGQGADGEDLRVTTTGNATGNGLQITVSYFVLPS